jgi:hypothetical protein
MRNRLQDQAGPSAGRCARASQPWEQLQGVAPLDHLQIARLQERAIVQGLDQALDILLEQGREVAAEQDVLRGGELQDGGHRMRAVEMASS